MFKRILISLRYSLLLVLFPILSGVMITVSNITDKMTIYSVQGVSIHTIRIVNLVGIERLLMTALGPPIIK